uniref:Mitochondrial import inner membrane translocase subunit Tim21 n=1 Tax=Leersia perrieri TaxID=77586 RepID=A0A0D9VL75_9ORYZ
MSAAAAGARKLAGAFRLLAAGRVSGRNPLARAPPCEASILPHCSYSAVKTGERGGSTDGRKRSRGRRIVTIGVISIAGGVALSALNDLAIFHGCSSKAIKKASENREVVEAIGVPIVRGPWYDASLAVGHRRRSVSCTFPVSGPHGSGIFQFKAIRNGEDGLLSFLRHHDWEILIMEAHLHVPSDDDMQKTLKIDLTGSPDHPS